jgi:hypothetical protein
LLDPQLAVDGERLAVSEIFHDSTQSASKHS